MKIDKKIKSADEIKDMVRALKKTGKISVLSVGIFDILHPGIIRHLQRAKKQGDILIAAVIRNGDVKKGPERPIFDEQLRLENAASIEFVDFVCLVDNKKSLECVKKIKPDIFARGESLKKRDEQAMKMLEKEEKSIKSSGCEIYATGNISSSTNIINQFLDLYSAETKKYLSKMREKYGAAEIIKKINGLQDMKVLVIGDGIIDEYHYCESMRRSSKEPLVVNRYLRKEVFAGGAFAAANHMAGICNEVKLLSVLGEKESREKFIRRHLNKNIKPDFFYRKDSTTIIKRRYLEDYRSRKLFEICYMDKGDISKKEEDAVLKYLRKEVSKYDLVLALDFGHGLLTEKIIRFLEKKAKFLAVNAQTNSANTGFNMITKYKKVDFGCLTELEARLSCHDEYGSIENVIKNLAGQLNTKNIIMTRGKYGSMGFNSGSGFEYTPALSSKVVDMVGAGDAFFSFAAPCAAKKMPMDIVSFVGNVAGAIAVGIVCNKEPVSKNKLLEFINTLLA
ncbi:adenylyltransferase/cytidyltransferase family protein [bacterium]|nr:adenylyltransferase/cytidyltransferase family protein [bacterium]